MILITIGLSLALLSSGRAQNPNCSNTQYSPGGRFLCELMARTATIGPTTCTCGDKNMNRTVGGQETSGNEFPMIAGVIYVDSEVSSINCSAVIISNRRVMSAAHCVIRKTVTELGVVVGVPNVNVGDSQATQVFRVININIHPQYTEANYDYDISILTVGREIVFSDRVGPVCLPFKFLLRDFTGARVTVLGLSSDGPTSVTLQKVDVDVISQPACRRSVPSVTPRQICTNTPGKDSCQDYSGGPLLYTDPSNGRLYSVGIVSNCTAGGPTVNARVTRLLRWIVSVANDNYCRI